MEERVIVLFGSPGCEPCKAYRPVLEKFCSGAGIRLVYIDTWTDEGAEAASAWGVKSTPATLGLIGDEAVGLEFGSLTESRLRGLEWVKRLREGEAGNA